MATNDSDRLRRFIRHFKTAIRERGVLSIAKSIARRPFRKAPQSTFDAQYGTDTGGIRDLWRMSIASTNAEEGTRYESSDAESLRGILDRLPIDRPNACFVDLGCGKGLPLMVAWQSGFGRVIGADFAAELVDAARENARRLGASTIQVLHQDAVDFTFPEAETLVLYLFHPFSGSVFSRVAGKLQSYVLSHPNTMVYVLYRNPHAAPILDEFMTQIVRGELICVWRR